MYIGFRAKLTIITLAGIALLSYALFNWFGLGPRPADYARSSKRRAHLCGRGGDPSREV